VQRELADSHSGFERDRARAEVDELERDLSVEPGIDEAMTAAAAAKGLDWSELRPQLKKAERWHVETY